MRLLILFLLLCCQNVFAQTVKTEAEKINREKFKGKVKEIKVYNYYNLPTSAFDETQEILKDKKHEFLFLKYDEKGYLMSTLSFRYNSIEGTDIKRSGPLVKREYSHYPNGKLKQEKLSEKEGRWTQTKISDYFYDEHGRISKIAKKEKLQKEVRDVQIFTYQYSADRTQIFNKKGELEEIEYLDSLGRAIKTVNYVNGNPVYYKEYDYIFLEEKGEIGQVVTRYKMKGGYRGENIYNDRGYRIETRNLAGTKTIDNRYFRNAISMNKKLTLEKVVSEGITYTYKIYAETGDKELISKKVPVYDEKESLIKEYTFSVRGNEKENLSLTEYEITYWKD